MFHKEVKRILENRGWTGRLSPSGLLEMWEAFVKDCELGYNFGIYEYDNDLSVRNVIELILQNANLRNYSACKEFKQNVLIIDKRFKELLSNKFFRDDKMTWWSRGILSEADGEYLEDIKNLYGYKVKKIDN